MISRHVYSIKDGERDVKSLEFSLREVEEDGDAGIEMLIDDGGQFYESLMILTEEDKMLKVNKKVLDDLGITLHICEEEDYGWT